MAELIHLVNDISTPVKLGWVGVVLWGAVQFMWYQRGRALPEDMDIEPASEGWSTSRLLSIAPARDLPVHDTSGREADLGEAAGIALESLLDTNAGDGMHREEEAAEAFGATGKRVSYQSTMSY
jgi:hypothetical protein